MDLSKLTTAQLEQLLAAAQREEKGAKFQANLDAERKAGQQAMTDEMPWWQKALAGAGKAFVDTGRGISQLTPWGPSEAAIDETKRLDAPLMDTGWGMTGNLLGNVAIAAPTAMIPGANTLLGAGAVGTAMGLSQPVGKDDSRVGNAAIGLAGGAALPAGVAAWRTGRALLDPLTEAGRSRLVGETINRFASDPAALMRMNPRELVAGSKPTLAQSTLDPGLASLERAVMTQPGEMQGLIAARYRDQNTARQAAMRGIAGTEAEIDAMTQARDIAATRALSPMDSSTAQIDVSPTIGLIDRIMSGRSGVKPEIAEKVQQARALLLNEEGAPRADFMRLYGAKQSMDFMLAKIKMESPAAKMQSREINAIKRSLENQIRKAMPEYGDYLKAYRGASKEIDQKKVLQYIQDAGQGGVRAMPDTVSGEFNLLAPSFQGAVEGGKHTVKKATGFNRPGPLENLLDQQQLGTIRAVQQDLQRSAHAAREGSVRGSPTAQFQSSQNILRQMLGPMGMPQSWSESVIAQMVAKPIDWTYALGRVEPKIQAQLAAALLDPQQAARLAAMGQKPMAPWLAAAGRYMPGSASRLALGGMFAQGGEE